MSCRRFDRNEYEVRLAEYLRPATAAEEGTHVYIDHYPKSGDSGQLIVTVGGGAGLSGDSPYGELEECALLDEERAVSFRKVSNQWSKIVLHCPPQRPDINVPFFTITLIDWPLRRGAERDLGPDFREALGLLTDACMKARETAAREAFPGLFEDQRPTEEEASG